MYIPTVNILIGSQADPIDAIILWLSQGFILLGNFICERFNAINNWIVSVWPDVVAWFTKVSEQISEFVTTEYPVVVEFTANALRWVDGWVSPHPWIVFAISMTVFIGPWILLLPLLFLQILFGAFLGILGFGVAGIIGGSPAASFQSAYYGGMTPAGGLFSMFQSLGAHYHVATLNPLLLIIRVVAAVFSLFVLFRYIWV